MADFSATEAAFIGFRIVRERPRAVAEWALLQILVGFALTGIFVNAGGSSLMTVQPFQPMPTEEAFGTLGKLLPAYGVALATSIFVQGIFLAAMGRAVFRPDDDRFGYLRLGREEFLQMTVVFLVFLAAFAVAFMVALVLGILGGVAASAMGAEGAPAGVGFVFLSAVLGLIGMIIVAVRLSLAAPTTFVTGRVSLGTSWRLTKGRFWPLAGTYILALALAGVVSTLGLAISLAVVAVAGGGLDAVAQVFKPDTSSLAAYFSRGRVIYLTVSGVVGALTWPVVVAPAFVIYRSLAAGADAPAPHPWTQS